MRVSHPRLGSALFWACVLGLAVLAVDAVHPLPGTLPRLWSRHRALWLLLTVAGAGTGLALQRSEEDFPPQTWRPVQPGVRFREVMVLTRAGCHLCDAALETLAWHAEYLPEIQSADVDADPHWQREHGEHIPVVLCDGEVRFRGRVPVVLLRRLIEGTPPIS